MRVRWRSIETMYGRCAAVPLLYYLATDCAVCCWPGLFRERLLACFCVVFPGPQYIYVESFCNPAIEDAFAFLACHMPTGSDFFAFFWILKIVSFPSGEILLPVQLLCVGLKLAYIGIIHDG